MGGFLRSTVGLYVGLDGFGVVVMVGVVSVCVSCAFVFTSPSEGRFRLLGADASRCIRCRRETHSLGSLAPECTAGAHFHGFGVENPAERPPGGETGETGRIRAHACVREGRPGGPEALKGPDASSMHPDAPAKTLRFQRSGENDLAPMHPNASPMHRRCIGETPTAHWPYSI